MNPRSLKIHDHILTDTRAAQVRVFYDLLTLLWEPTCPAWPAKILINQCSNPNLHCFCKLFIPQPDCCPVALWPAPPSIKLTQTYSTHYKLTCLTAFASKPAFMLRNCAAAATPSRLNNKKVPEFTRKPCAFAFVVEGWRNREAPWIQKGRKVHQRCWEKWE